MTKVRSTEENEIIKKALLKFAKENRVHLDETNMEIEEISEFKDLQVALLSIEKSKPLLTIINNNLKKLGFTKINLEELNEFNNKLINSIKEGNKELESELIADEDAIAKLKNDLKILEERQERLDQERLDLFKYLTEFDFDKSSDDETSFVGENSVTDFMTDSIDKNLA